MIKCDAHSIIGRRSRNEDSYLTAINKRDGEYLFVIADGLGGHPHGHIASSVVCQYMVKTFIERPHSVKWSENINEFIRAGLAANEFLKSVFMHENHQKRPATTMTAMTIAPTSWAFIHAGDCSIVHKYSGLLFDYTKPDHAQNKNILTNCLGTGAVEFQFGSSNKLPKKSKFWMFTDGMIVPRSELGKLSALDLCNKSFQSGSLDNITTMIIETD